MAHPVPPANGLLLQWPRRLSATVIFAVFHLDLDAIEGDMPGARSGSSAHDQAGNVLPEPGGAPASGPVVALGAQVLAVQLHPQAVAQQIKGQHQQGAAHPARTTLITRAGASARPVSRPAPKKTTPTTNSNRPSFQARP